MKSSSTDLNKVELLKVRIRQCLANARRQRRKEELSRHTRQVVRVSSRFWEQAAADYRRQIDLLLKQ